MEENVLKCLKNFTCLLEVEDLSSGIGLEGLKKRLGGFCEDDPLATAGGHVGGERLGAKRWEMRRGRNERQEAGDGESGRKRDRWPLGGPSALPPPFSTFAAPTPALAARHPLPASSPL